MRRWIGALAGIVLLGAGHIARTAPDLAPRETKDRRDDDALRQQLSAPLAAADAGDMARAGREFEIILAQTKTQHGAQSLQAADIISAFGVELFILKRKAEAATYLKRAIEAYRLATGPDDPEVAVADNDYANVVLDLDPDATLPELLEAVRDALRIRRQALGEDNGETAATYVLLGRVTGNPALTSGDNQKIESAADLIRRGATQLPKAAIAKPYDVADGWYRLAELYAHNGRGAEALAAAADYWKAIDGRDPIEAMIRSGSIEKLAEALADAGQADAAATLRKTYPPTAGF